MNPWLPLLGLSALAGAVAAVTVNGRKGLFIAGAVPWCGLLAFLLYTEYFVPYQGGGASMWPIAQLFGGTIAAFVGIAAAALVRAATGRS